jgi:hypothetical protein
MDPMLDLDSSARRGDLRFLRHANAVTQAEIHRLSRLESSTEERPHDVVDAVQHELRRLATPRPASRRDPGPAAGGA